MLALCAGLLGVAPAVRGSTIAQSASDGPWFPGQRFFNAPLAAPREIRQAAALVYTDLFESSARNETPQERPPFTFRDPEAAAQEVQGAVALGGLLPVYRAAKWPDGGVVIGVEAGIFSRFRIEKPSRDDVGTDWMVALPVELRRGRVSGRVRLLHRSAHLGDELIQETGARRIEFGHEALDLVAAYRILPTARAYAGGAFIFRSNTEAEPLLRGLDLSDNAALHAGFDAEWHPWLRGRLGLVGGLDWQSAQRTEWASALALVGGLEARTPRRRVRLLLRFYDGPSALGEFFLTDERFWGLEFSAEL